MDYCNLFFITKYYAILSIDMDRILVRDATHNVMNKNKYLNKKIIENDRTKLIFEWCFKLNG